MSSGRRGEERGFPWHPLHPIVQYQVVMWRMFPSLDSISVSSFPDADGLTACSGRLNKAPSQHWWPALVAAKGRRGMMRGRTLAAQGQQLGVSPAAVEAHDDTEGAVAADGGDGGDGAASGAAAADGGYGGMVRSSLRCSPRAPCRPCRCGAALRCTSSASAAMTNSNCPAALRQLAKAGRATCSSSAGWLGAPVSCRAGNPQSSLRVICTLHCQLAIGSD